MVLFDLVSNDPNAYLIVNEARVWIVNTDMFPGECPEKPSAELLMHKFFIERCVRACAIAPCTIGPSSS